MNKVAIVGGAGFLGSALYRKLKSENLAAVDVFDVYNRNGIEECDFHELDVLRAADVQNAIQDYDIVYHKVGLMGPASSFEQPMRSYRLNLESALNVLQACVAAAVKQFVFDSTESVFGPVDRCPFDEDQTPHPASLYGGAKYIAERYMLHFASHYGLCAVALRYPRVVAPGQANVLQALQERVADSAPITITAEGRKTFDLVHVDDVVCWNVWFLDNRESGIMHVSPGMSVSAAEIADGLAQRLHGERSYHLLSYTSRETDNDRLLPDKSALSSIRSQRRTGLGFRFRTLDELLDVFCESKTP